MSIKLTNEGPNPALGTPCMTLTELPRQQATEAGASEVPEQSAKKDAGTIGMPGSQVLHRVRGAATSLQPSPARLQASSQRDDDFKWIRSPHMNNRHDGALGKEMHHTKTFRKPPVGLSQWDIKLEQVKSSSPKTL